MAAQFIAVVKRGYYPLSDDSEECIPGNYGAIRFGLDALLAEDARDYVRSRELWAMAEAELVSEVEDETGAGAQGKIDVEDSLEMEWVGEGL